MRKVAAMSMRFDELSKSLAANVSRRDAFKLTGGAVAGALLASMGLGKTERAEAAPSSCAVFCGKTSFTSGPAHASCLQACHQCGADTSRICQTPTGFVCCPSGQVCSPATQTCVATCTCPSFTACGTGNCLCVTTTENTSACVIPSCGPPCTSSTDCGPGAVCFQSTDVCCGNGTFCVQLCA